MLAEQQQPRRLVAFDPVHFDKYVGYYELAPNAIFKISRDGDSFFTQLTGQGPVEVFPESETKFFATLVAAQISFVIDPQGNVNALVLHQNGLEQRAKKIDQATADNFAAAIAARIKDNQPSPGTEESVRKWLLALESGQPNYADMTPGLANIARQQWPRTSEVIKAFGPLKDIRFICVKLDGSDVYRAEFEHSTIDVFVGPLAPDGKVAYRHWTILTSRP
jgi:hypothetical protein